MLKFKFTYSQSQNILYFKKPTQVQEIKSIRKPKIWWEGNQWKYQLGSFSHIKK